MSRREIEGGRDRTVIIAPDLNSRIIILDKRLHPREAAHAVDRSSPLGNPFHMNKENDRNKVCTQYDKWLQAHATDPDVQEQLLKLEVELRKTGQLFLACWCAPMRCHAESIALLLLKRLEDTT